MTHRSPDAPTRLLDAALAEFAALGQAGARTERIARRAGVNKQLIHYYYRTKVGLYGAVVGHAAEAVADQPTLRRIGICTTGVSRGVCRAR